MSKIEKEKKTMALMMKIYCKKKHKHKDCLCEECQELLDYAHKRLDNCRHGEHKSFCAHCKTQCYKKDMKARVKEVMKFSGPRLIFYCPGQVIKHMFG